MKKIIIFCLASVLVYSALAKKTTAITGNNQIVHGMISETGKKNKPVYVYKHKKYETRPVYDYTIFCLLKNTGNEEITVVTKGLNPSIETMDENKPVKIRLTIDERKYQGSLVVPSITDFGLVTLKPGEIAQIRLKTSSFRPLCSGMIEYEPRDHFGGRFGYWVGVTTCEPFKIITKPNK